MNDTIYSIRPISAADIPQIIAYHHTLKDRYSRMLGQGSDAQLPDFDKMQARLAAMIDIPHATRTATYDIFEINGNAIGHAVLLSIVPGDKAQMHFHIWRGRMQGQNFSDIIATGRSLATVAMRHFFTSYNLQMIIGEPAASNPLPNRVLKGLGLKPVKTHTINGGALAGTITANRYEIPRSYFPDLA